MTDNKENQNDFAAKIAEAKVRWSSIEYKYV